MDIQGYLETLRLLPRPSGDDDGDCEACSKTTVRDKQGFSISAVLAALGIMYSVHNLIAPNMTAIAKAFHFNAFQKDTYIGGELTLCFYFPGVLGALLAGVLSGIMERKLLFAGLAFVTSITCLCTASVVTFSGLVWARTIAGFAIGGALPVVYSLVGDWYPARKRASATAFVTAASGAGVFGGQCLATLMGSSDWRWPFFLIAVPCLAASLTLWLATEEPVRGGQEDGVDTASLYQNAGFNYSPALSGRHFRTCMRNKTNLLVILQAFPGNIPWGVIIVYIHDFLVQDLGLSRHNALGAITTLAASAFAGILTGGFIGERLYGASSKHLALFGGICNVSRALPFFILFGWRQFFGPLDPTQSQRAFYTLLVVGGFVATMGSPCTGAMLLNVNLPETRGSVMAMYSVLDDLSKGFGTFFVSMIVELVGGRAVAYQISLLLWVVTGVALLYGWHTYDEDERRMRETLDEAAMESMVLTSKQRARQSIRDCAKAAGEAHFAQHSLGARSDQLADNLWSAQRRLPGMAALFACASESVEGVSAGLSGGGGGDACPRSSVAGSGSLATADYLSTATGPRCGDDGQGAYTRTGVAGGGVGLAPATARNDAGNAMKSRQGYRSGDGRLHTDRDRLHRAARAAAEAAAASAPRCGGGFVSSAIAGAHSSR